MEEHPPAVARRLIQEAKSGRRPPKVLMEDARHIVDPSHAATTLFFLAGHQAVDRRTAAKALTDTLELVAKIDRDWRKGEVLDELARRGPTWREWDAIEGPLAEFQEKVVTMAIALDDAGLGKALPGVARWTPDAHIAPLLRRALSSADASDNAKVVLSYGAGEGVMAELERLPDAALKARLMTFLHGHNESPMTAQVVASLKDVPAEKALDTFRAVIASLEQPDDLATVESRLPADPETKARLLCALAAKYDKMGHADEASQRFDEADRIAGSLDPKRADAVRKNITQGRARLGGKAAPKPIPTPRFPPDRQAMPPNSATPANAATAGNAARPAVPDNAAPPTSGPHTGAMRAHILGLVGTYEGKLAEPHLRAVARAAPLCWAFGLDLAFIGFPGTLADVVKAASKSGIGEGAGYLERLQRANRLHMVAGGEDDAKALLNMGHLVATTPHPQPGRTTDFKGALTDARRFGRDRLVVLMGLGPKGIPAGLLRDAPVHVELTGQQVSLETATAMGIIAERLRQL